jgi:aspartate/methionine/tyrosine aminotransferase
VRFSRRIRWNLVPNRISQTLEAKRSRGEAILDLTGSNPTTAGLQYDIQAIREALAHPHLLEYDPAPRGLFAARCSISNYYGGRVDPERIILTASTSEAYSLLFKLLADPGDQVLVPRPSYPLFDYLAALESVYPVQYPLDYDHGWNVDADAVRRMATAVTRAIILVNPNNPTGSYVKRQELDALSAIAVQRDLVLISDEVFSDFAFGPDPTRVTSLTEGDALSFSLSGLSKVCGLPHVKAGWIVVNGPVREATAALERLELIADTFLSVSSLVQHALPRLLETRLGVQTQIRERTAENLALLHEAVRDSPCRVLDVEGGWYATVQVPRMLSEEEWSLTLLKRQNVLVQPGYFYDFDREAFLVFSLLTPRDTFAEGSQRFLMEVGTQV